MALEIKPAEGKVALQLLDDGDEDDDTQPTNGEPSAEPAETMYAIVLGVGPDVKGVKKGSTVLVYEWARNCPRVDDDVVIADKYCILATVS